MSAPAVASPTARPTSTSSSVPPRSVSTSWSPRRAAKRRSQASASAPAPSTRDEIAEREPLGLAAPAPGRSPASPSPGGGGVGLQARPSCAAASSNSPASSWTASRSTSREAPSTSAAEVPLELERVEVVRGAASSLYGSDALAGVIQLVTRTGRRGRGRRLRAEAEGGKLRMAPVSGGGTSGRPAAPSTGASGACAGHGQPGAQRRVSSETAGAASLGGAPRRSLRAAPRASAARTGTRHPGPDGVRPPRSRRAPSTRRAWSSARDWRFVTRDRAAHDVRVGFASSDQVSRDPLDSGTYTPLARSVASGRSRSPTCPTPTGFRTTSRRRSAGYRPSPGRGGRTSSRPGWTSSARRGAVGSRSDDLLSPRRTNAGAYVQDRARDRGRPLLHPGRPRRAERQLRHPSRPASRGGLAAPPRAREPHHSAGQRGGRDQGAQLLPVLRVVLLRSGEPRPQARAQPHLRLRRSSSASDGDVFGPRPLSSTTITWTRSPITLVDFDHLPGDLREPGQDPGARPGAGLATRRRRGGSGSARDTRSWTARSWSASATSIPSTPPASRSSAPAAAPGLALARGRRDGLAVGASLVLVGQRADSDFLGLGPDGEPGYARSTRARMSRVGQRLEVFVTGENLFDRQLPGSPGLPGPRALRARRICASQAVPVVSRDGRPARLEQRQGQRLQPSRPPPARGRGGGRPAHDRQRQPTTAWPCTRCATSSSRPRPQAAGLSRSRSCRSRGPAPTPSTTRHGAGHAMAARQAGVDAGVAFGDLFLQDVRQLPREPSRGHGPPPRSSPSGAGRPALGRGDDGKRPTRPPDLRRPARARPSFAGREFDRALLDRLAGRRRPLRRERRVPHLRLGWAHVSPPDPRAARRRRGAGRLRVRAICLPASAEARARPRGAGTSPPAPGRV